jgi:hypothetical protein
VFTARYVQPTKCTYLFYCGSEKVQRLFHCDVLSDYFYNRAGVGFCEVCSAHTMYVFITRRFVYSAVRSAGTMYL